MAADRAQAAWRLFRLGRHGRALGLVGALTLSYYWSCAGTCSGPWATCWVLGLVSVYKRYELGSAGHGRRGDRRSPGP